MTPPDWLWIPIVVMALVLAAIGVATVIAFLFAGSGTRFDPYKEKDR